MGWFRGALALLAAAAIAAGGLAVFLHSHVDRKTETRGAETVPLDESARLLVPASDPEAPSLDRESISVVEARMATVAAPNAPIAPHEEDYSDLAGNEFETNPRVMKARILRHTLREYEATAPHTTLRAKEFGLMLLSIGPILEAGGHEGGMRADGTFAPNEGGHRLTIAGVEYIFARGEFPEYEAWEQRQRDIERDHTLYEAPMDPKIMDLLVERAKQALVLLESGG